MVPISKVLESSNIQQFVVFIFCLYPSRFRSVLRYKTREGVVLNANSNTRVPGSVITTHRCPRSRAEVPLCGACLAKPRVTTSVLLCRGSSASSSIRVRFYRIAVLGEHDFNDQLIYGCDDTRSMIRNHVPRLQLLRSTKSMAIGGSAGQIPPGITARVERSDRTLADFDEPGELVAKTPSMSLSRSYCRNVCKRATEHGYCALSYLTVSQLASH